MLKCLTKDRVERKIWPNNVLFYPHLAAKALNLLPKAVQILKKVTNVIDIIHRKDAGKTNL